MLKTSPLFSVFISLLYLWPSWSLEHAIKVKVINMSSFEHYNEHLDVSQDLRVGIAMNLKERELSSNVFKHALSIPFPSFDGSIDESLQIRKKQPHHLLSICLLEKDATTDENKRKQNELYSYSPLYTMHAGIREQDLIGSTIYVMFEGLQHDVPLNVIVVTDDNPVRDGRRLQVQKLFRNQGFHKIIKSIKKLLFFE